MEKNTKIMIAITIICFIIGAFLLVGFKKKYNIVDDQKKDGELVSALLPFVEKQEDINKDLKVIENSSKYTFDNAYVELNPYGISPLSGIVIFQTENDEEIQVYINDKLFTTMEKSKKHTIPLYGLYENKKNIIKLVSGNKEATYTITTAKSNIEYPINVEVAHSSLNDDIYFTEGSMVSGLTGWDKEGNLRFYLTQMLKMDVEWLDNGHFIIGTEQGNDLDGYKALDRYLAFVEMDYLGKVYNYYTLPYGYDFETQILKNGNIMIGGGTTPIYYDEHIIYTFDAKNNKITSEMNLSEAIKKIDPNFDKEKLGPTAGKNGFYYDENTKELVVSFRNLNALISFNYETKDINWVFTNPENKYFQSEVWKTKLLNSTFYPYGQHSPQILGNGTYAMFNNNYDRINPPTTVKPHKDQYSEAQIFSIQNGIVNLLWSSSSLNELHLTQKFGLFRVLPNNNRLIDFGWILHDDYYNSDTNTFQEAEGNVDNTYSIYLELDQNNNVLFKATCEEGKYRIFKHSLYNTKTSNVNVEQLNIYENIKKDKYTSKRTIDYNLEDAMDYINYFEFTKNSFYTDLELKEDDDIELLFEANEKIYIFKYKEKDSKFINRVFNLELPNGRYKFYIKINDTIYKTNKIYKY